MVQTTEKNALMRSRGRLGYREHGFRINKTTINPKFGLIWLTSPNTTMRTAVFRTQKREFGNNQTIEPTQVSGFNQFFDDDVGTESWRFGVGIDHRINEAMNIGYEWSKRQIELPSYISNSISGDGRYKEYSHYGKYYLICRLSIQ